MTDREKYNLYNLIEKEHGKKNYKEVLILLDQYLEFESIGIDEKLLSIYIDCNIGIGNLEEALKIINLIKKMFPQTYNKYFLAKRYMDCWDFDNAVKIIDNNIFTDKEYYNMARRLFLYGEYYLARKYFNCCISITDKDYLIEKSNKYIDKIKKYFNDNKFVEQNYRAYKRKGNIIQPGDVIFTLNVEEKYRKLDPYWDRRTYLVWKVAEDSLYCLPLTTKTKNSDGLRYGYTLFKQDYLNFETDYMTKERVVIINECDVEKILEKITVKDFNKVLKCLCKHLCFMEDSEREDNKELIEYYSNSMNISNGDIIILYGKCMPQRKYYYVLSVDKELGKYKTSELKKDKEMDKLFFVNSVPVYIKNNDLIYSVTKLTAEEKEYLDGDLKLNQKLKKLVLN